MTRHRQYLCNLWKLTILNDNKSKKHHPMRRSMRQINLSLPSHIRLHALLWHAGGGFPLHVPTVVLSHHTSAPAATNGASTLSLSLGSHTIGHKDVGVSQLCRSRCVRKLQAV